jgi:hypothetical protein
MAPKKANVQVEGSPVKLARPNLPQGGGSGGSRLVDVPTQGGGVQIDMPVDARAQSASTRTKPDVEDASTRTNNSEVEGASTKSKSWFEENPGKTALAALGIGLLVDGYLDSEAEAQCLTQCLPTNYSSSDEGGTGTLTREEMDYQLTNDPHCNANSKDCMDFCIAGCKQTSLAETAAGVAGGVAGAGAKAGSNVFTEFLKGLGLDMPMFIAIVIVIIIIIVVFTMM